MLYGYILYVITVIAVLIEWYCHCCESVWWQNLISC